MIGPLFVVIDYRLKLIQFWLYGPLIRIPRLSQWWLTSNIRPLLHRIGKTRVILPNICLILWFSSCLIPKLRCWVLHIARLVELIRLSSCCCWRHEGSIHVALDLGWCVIVFCNQSSFLLTRSPCLCRFPTFFRLAPEFTNFNFIRKRNCLIRREILISVILLSCLSFTFSFMDFISWLVRTLHSSLMIFWQLPIRATESCLILTCETFLKALSWTLFVFLEILVIDSSRLWFLLLNIAETLSYALIWWPIDCVCISLLIFFLDCIMCDWGRKIRVDSDAFSITWLSSCSSSRTVTDWISNYIWLDWCYGLNKLLKTNFCITIKIKSPHDCNKLFFDRALANLF